MLASQQLMVSGHPAGLILAFLWYFVHAPASLPAATDFRCSTVPNETTMDTRLRIPESNEAPLPTPKAWIGQARKPAPFAAIFGNLLPAMLLGHFAKGNLGPLCANQDHCPARPAPASGSHSISGPWPNSSACSPWTVDRRHSKRTATFPVRGQRQIDLLSGSSHSLDRKPTGGKTTSEPV